MTKSDVKKIILQKHAKAADVTRALHDYFNAPKENIVELAEKIFADPVDSSGASVTLGQDVTDGPGLLTPPRTTQLPF